MEGNLIGIGLRGASSPLQGGLLHPARWAAPPRKVGSSTPQGGLLHPARWAPPPARGILCRQEEILFRMGAPLLARGSFAGWGLLCWLGAPFPDGGFSNGQQGLPPRHGPPNPASRVSSPRPEGPSPWARGPCKIGSFLQDPTSRLLEAFKSNMTPFCQDFFHLLKNVALPGGSRITECLVQLFKCWP